MVFRGAGCNYSLHGHFSMIFWSWELDIQNIMVITVTKIFEFSLSPSLLG